RTRTHRQDHQRRPGPNRQFAVIEPGHLHCPVRPGPRTVRAAARGQGPRLPAAPLQLQPEGGRCEACEGMGQKRIEMHFLPDVWVECDTCGGTRYNPETLAVKYHGKSIADVLNLRVSEALELFGNLPRIRHILQTLDDVGLGYMALGQPAP